MDTLEKTKTNWKKIIITSLIIIIIGLVFFIAVLRKPVAQEQKNTDSIASVVEAVGKLLVLPTNETPTLATVSDPEALKGQAFFKNAKTGDKVLIYTTAQKAVLYDPVANKIVEVAPINLSDQQ